MVEDKLLWLTTKRKDLVEVNRGRWIVIDPEHDKVFASDDLGDAIREFQKEHPHEEPHFVQLPRKDEELIAYGIFL